MKFVALNDTTSVIGIFTRNNHTVTICDLWFNDASKNRCMGSKPTENACDWRASNIHFAALALKSAAAIGLSNLTLVVPVNTASLIFSARNIIKGNQLITAEDLSIQLFKDSYMNKEKDTFLTVLRELASEVINVAEKGMKIHILKEHNISSWEIVVPQGVRLEHGSTITLNNSLGENGIKCLDCGVLTGDFKVKYNNGRYFIDRSKKYPGTSPLAHANVCQQMANKLLPVKVEASIDNFIIE